MIPNLARKKNIARLITLLLAGIAGVVFKTQDSSCCGVEYSTLSGVFVLDGDTIRAKSLKESIRLIGIDAPEISANERAERQSDWWRCSVGEVNSAGIKAKTKLQNLLKGATISVEYGEDPEDQFGRKLGYIYIKRDNRSTLINATLLESGLVRRFRVRGNSKHDGALDAAEATAREKHLGLWAQQSGCQF